jgi:hypothetical protein
VVFETLDPERWVPAGYACVRVDSRGSGWSPGFLDPWSESQTRDLYQCIEWAAEQAWCSGKIGLAGTSNYAHNQWQVAAMHPPHLAAMVPMGGVADVYRELARHGGILSKQMEVWYHVQVEGLQYGVADESPRNPLTGEPAAGPETLTESERARNRSDFWDEMRTRTLDDEWYQERSAREWSAIQTPFLSIGQWGSQGDHLRGNVEGFVRAGSGQKWLFVNCANLISGLLGEQGTHIQRRFFDHFLKGADNGWEREPRVHLEVRHPDGSRTERFAEDWPLPGTEWTTYYLDADNSALLRKPTDTSQVSYQPMTEPVTFTSAPFESSTEVTGPLAARLWISSATADADLFLVLRVMDRQGKDVQFRDAFGKAEDALRNVSGGDLPAQPLATGWLRASHRKLDRGLSVPYRPYHTHDEAQPLIPGTIYEVEVEIWPTSIVIPHGYRLALTVGGKDSGMHNIAGDRPTGTFSGEVTIYTGDAHPSQLLAPQQPKFTEK